MGEGCGYACCIHVSRMTNQIESLLRNNDIMKRLLFLTLLMAVAIASVRAKTLVVYYSYTGNCKAIAHALTQ